MDPLAAGDTGKPAPDPSTTIALTHREESMKFHSLLTLAGLVIGFAGPAFAQQKDTTDPQIIQQLEEIGRKNDDAFNRNDAAAEAELFTDNAVFVTPRGLVYGRQAIEKWHADVFQRWHHSNHLTKGDQTSPPVVSTTGNEAWWVGEWSNTLQTQNGRMDVKGYWSAVYVREGDAWKVRMLSYNVNMTPPPAAASAATPAPTTTPSNK
jgi:ketosteroid isomerase-like protein